VRRWLASVRHAAGDEARRVRHERSVLLVLVVIPLLYPAVIAALYRTEDARERPVVLVDLDRSDLSRRLALDLDATPELQVTGGADALDVARAAVARDEAELAIVIPADFSSRLKHGDGAQLAVWTGGANLYTWGLAYPAVHAVVGATNARLAAGAFLAAGLPPAAARARAAPIATGERLLFHPAATYGRYFAAGVLLIVLQQLVLLSLAVSAGVRREQGVPALDPERPLAEGLGRAAAHAPFWSGAALLVVGVVLPGLGWSGPGAGATGVLVAAFLAANVPIAIGIARFVPDRKAAFELLLFLSLPLFAASGFTWPVDQLPSVVRAVAAPFPATPALRALRILSMKSGDLSAVLPELAWLAAQVLGWSCAAALLLRLPSPGGGARRSGPLLPESFVP
jgi:ABC-2 type transport system permease protein